MVKVAIMGYGTVGSGVYEIIRDNNFDYEALNPIGVKYILDIRDFPDHPQKELFTKNFDDILNDGEVYCVVEAMGGLHPAYEFTKALLENGKNVVTSNKELVATYGPELLQIAKDKNVNYLFEASVGGGIPIIKPMCSSLMSNKIQKIIGILNGTTNFILTEMIEKNKDFSEALSDAQKNGYAERDPSADVEGHDACRKLAILSSLAWSEYVDYKDIDTEGITKITLDDVKYADKFGYVIKLIGYSEKNDKVFARVSPMFVSKNYPLSGVCGVFNAIVVKGNYLGTSMFYGRGAGKFPTASAVVADVIDSVRHIGAKKQYLEWKPAAEGYIKPANEGVFRFFVRSQSQKEQIESLFGNVEFADGIKDGETGFITDLMTEKEFLDKANILNVNSFIRVLEA
ncbi:MAG: homoserine dehydrogenase [Ruminococcaceae bacterium]|nr:homoserine dehydrogenase [Oscillospiraceae bacterium]